MIFNIKVVKHWGTYMERTIHEETTKNLHSVLTEYLTEEYDCFDTNEGVDIYESYDEDCEFVIFAEELYEGAYDPDLDCAQNIVYQEVSKSYFNYVNSKTIGNYYLDDCLTELTDALDVLPRCSGAYIEVQSMLDELKEISGETL